MTRHKFSFWMYMLALASWPLAVSHGVARGAGLPDPVFVVPSKVKSCTVEDALDLIGTVETPVHAVLRAGWNVKIEKIHVVRGQKVKKGQLLVSSDPGFFKQQISFYERQSALLARSVSNYRADLKGLGERENRVRGLVEKDIAPKSQLEELERAIATTTAELQRAEKMRGDLLAELKLAKSRADKSNFYSPIDGVVTQMIADPRALSGSLVAQFNTVIARIDSPGSYIVKSQVLDFQMTSPKAGQNATVTLPHGEAIAGRVDFVAPVPVPEEAAQNPWSQTPQKESFRFDVWVRFDRPGPIIAAGTSAEVRVNLAQHTAKLCVPVNALRVDRGRPSLAVRHQKDGWRLVPVVTGRIDHARVEILSGAKSGEIVAASLW